MSSTQFVEMYHPLIPSTEVTPARVPVQAIDENAARGWLLVDPDGVLPTPVTPYYTKEALLSQIQGGAAPIGTALRAALGLPVAATATASGTLVAQKHNPVDASGGAKTMTLPTGAAPGSLLAVEKLDSSANAITLSGSIRSVGSSSITLVGQHETLTFTADSDGYWWPVAGHKTKTWLDNSYVASAVAQSAQALFPAPRLRGDAMDSWIARPLGSDATRHPLEWIHDDTSGYLFHLTGGPNMGGIGTLIGMGIDAGGTGLYAHNKKTGVGIKITQEDTITSALAYGLLINNGSSVAPGFWFGSGRTNSKPGQTVANVIGDAGARLWEWRTSSYRTDTVTTTSGSPVVTDAALVIGDIGKLVSAVGIPAQSYVGPNSVPGTSIRLSSSATSQVDVNATASATVSAKVAQGNGDVLVGFITADTGQLVWQAPFIVSGADFTAQANGGVGGNVTGVSMLATGAGPSLAVYDSGGTANSRRFKIAHSSGTLAFQARNDVGASAGAGDLLLLQHSTGNATFHDGATIASGAQATGLKFGASAAQKLGFYGATPIVQQARPTDIAGVIAALAALGLTA